MTYFRQFYNWLTSPATPVPLGLFRIQIALFCIFKLWVIRHSLIDHYGQYGFIQWAITAGNLPEGVPHLGHFANYLKQFGLSADESVYLIVGTNVLALLALAVGICARVAALVAWCVDFLLMNAAGGMLYGMDFFTHIGLFYCILMPTGDALSIPVTLGWRTSCPSVAAGVTRKMLQIQMCIIYMSSGFEKAAGVQWWNGEAIWRSLMLPVFRQFDFTWMASTPWLAAAAGWGVLVVECGYGIAMWSKRTRGVWLTLVCLFHLGIGLFLGMWLFAMIMVILNLGAFGYEVWNDFISRSSPDAQLKEWTVPNSDTVTTLAS